jgi:hypothetical protein
VANLLHRFLRGRHAPEATDMPVEPAAEEPEPDVGEPTESAAAAKKPAGRGPRKTRDEVSSIGPGEPA